MTALWMDLSFGYLKVALNEFWTAGSGLETWIVGGGPL
jgi:hypothetical protein